MIVWMVFKLVCWMYGVSAIPPVTNFCAAVSAIELVCEFVYLLILLVCTINNRVDQHEDR